MDISKFEVEVITTGKCDSDSARLYLSNILILGQARHLEELMRINRGDAAPMILRSVPVTDTEIRINGIIGKKE